MTSAQQRIAETITSFYEEGSPLGYAGAQYKLAVSQMDDEARSELVSSSLSQPFSSRPAMESSQSSVLS